jgi:hypothetical protein
MRRTGLRTKLRELLFICFCPLFKYAINSHNWKVARSLWFNPSSADPSFLRAIEESMQTMQGDVLELGSGLTSIVISKLAEENGVRAVCLEESEFWAEKTNRRLKRLKMTSHLRHSPLKNFGNFDWYDYEQSQDKFSLVICDGPASQSATGGRVGLLPRLRNQIAGSQVLLDDCDRPGELGILRVWETEFECEFTLVASRIDKTFARVVVPH